MVVICRKLGGDTGCTPGERHYLTSRKINSFGRNFCEVTDLFTIDDVGGHQVNHITNRPQEALILQAVLVDFEAPPFLPRVRDAIFFYRLPFRLPVPFPFVSPPRSGDGHLDERMPRP